MKVDGKSTVIHQTMTDADRLVSRAQAFPELMALARGLVARYGGSVSPEIVAARGWLDRHCRGCAVPIAEGRRECRGCRSEWLKRRGGHGNGGPTKTYGAGTRED